MLNMDEFHFISYKKKAQLKIKANIGPYIVNTRATTKEVEAILSQMIFKPSFSWSYDPLGIISKLRLEQKSASYAHTIRPKIEQYANQEKWTEGTLQEFEERLISQSSMKNLIPKEKEGKREREANFPTDFET